MREPELELLIPVAPGELLDRISILLLKQEHIREPERQRYIGRELARLQQVRDKLPKSRQLEALFTQLLEINRALWQIEDELRAMEAARRFDEHFVEQARGVYINNDRRAVVKQQINELLGSNLRDQKSYTRY